MDGTFLTLINFNVNIKLKHKFYRIVNECIFNVVKYNFTHTEKIQRTRCHL